MPRVVFVCLGNVCRSQMAEAFGRQLGAGIFVSGSAGLAPGMLVDPVTKQVMAEKGLDLESQFPKAISLAVGKFGADLLVNMSGYPLPAGTPWPSVEWQVPDPHTKPIHFHREIRDLVERLVLGLVVEYRAKRRWDSHG
ncbi:MAG: hypothetical protein K2X03_16395 [Bryobacteraceae bacterium]|nr:hypothetical protein [Bryobacteraceae bacterium]